MVASHTAVSLWVGARIASKFVMANVGDGIDIRVSVDSDAQYVEISCQGQ